MMTKGKWISISVVTAVIAFFLSENEQENIDKIKKHPARFAYYVWPSGGVCPSLVTNEKDCLDEIQEFYEWSDKNPEGYLPLCQEFGIDPADTVYVLSLEPDSVSAFVAILDKPRVGPPKIRSGYILRSTLQDKPARQIDVL